MQRNEQRYGFLAAPLDALLVSIQFSPQAAQPDALRFSPRGAQPDELLPSFLLDGRLPDARLLSVPQIWSPDVPRVPERPD